MNKTSFLFAAIAGIVAGTALEASKNAGPSQKGLVKQKCLAGNGCKQKSACHVIDPKTKKMLSACAMQNSCAGKGWVYAYGKTLDEANKQCSEFQTKAKSILKGKGGKSAS